MPTATTPPTAPVLPSPAVDPLPERLSLLAELRVLDAAMRESRIDWRSELREGLRCAFGLRRTRRIVDVAAPVEVLPSAPSSGTRATRTGPPAPARTWSVPASPEATPAYAAPGTASS
jgi:hypothetical protein